MDVVVGNLDCLGLPIGLDDEVVAIDFTNVTADFVSRDRPSP